MTKGNFGQYTNADEQREREREREREIDLGLFGVVISMVIDTVKEREREREFSGDVSTCSTRLFEGTNKQQKEKNP